MSNLFGWRFQARPSLKIYTDSYWKCCMYGTCRYRLVMWSASIAIALRSYTVKSRGYHESCTSVNGLAFVMPFCDASIGSARFGLAIDILSVAFWFQHYQVKRVIGCDSVSRINGRSAVLSSSWSIDDTKSTRNQYHCVCGHCDVFGWWWSDEVDHYQFIDRLGAVLYTIDWSVDSCTLAGSSTTLIYNWIFMSKSAVFN